jgi:hypothetical protein
MKRTQCNWPTFTPVLALAFLPGVAHAQHIPWPLALAFVSPVFFVVLAIVLGILRRSWLIGLTHVALILIWVTVWIFVLRHIENDFVTGAPVVVYTTHALLILLLLGREIARRLTKKGDAV